MKFEITIYAILIALVLVGFANAQERYSVEPDSAVKVETSLQTKVESLSNKVENLDDRLDKVERVLGLKAPLKSVLTTSHSLNASQYGIRLNPGETLVSPPTVVKVQPLPAFKASPEPFRPLPQPTKPVILPRAKLFFEQSPLFQRK